MGKRIAEKSSFTLKYKSISSIQSGTENALKASYVVKNSHTKTFFLCLFYLNANSDVVGFFLMKFMVGVSHNKKSL